MSMVCLHCCLRLLLLVSILGLLVSENKFYIYDDWPPELEDVWPPAGAELHPKAGYNHEFRGNNGAGMLLDAKLGMFQTWQFALFQMLMARMKTSTRRTLDPKEATAFIIPFDLGVHSHLDHKDGRMRLASPHGWTAISLLEAAQQDTTGFWKNNGHDHFVVFGITAYQMVGIGVKVFYMRACQNCSVLTIETSPTHTAIPGRSKKYWFAQPYPSFFHYTEGMTAFPWDVQPTMGQRDITALFIGSVKTKNPKSNSLRRLLAAQCEGSSRCVWQKTSHACSGVVNQTSAIYLFRRARYCLAPPGDSLTRKSLFDSLLAGCVPVVFIRGSLTQYDWHLSAEDIDKVAVYIPMCAILDGGADFMQRLEGISDADLLAKQREIARIAPRLQYAVVPERVTAKKGSTWMPPFPDAAEVIIDKVTDPGTMEPRDGWSEVELFLQKKEQTFLMHNDEEFTGFPTKGVFNASAVAFSSGKYDEYDKQIMSRGGGRKRKSKASGKRRGSKKQHQLADSGDSEALDADANDFDEAIKLVESVEF